MPKELIYTPDAQFILEVNWGRDTGHIQIGSTTRPGQGNITLPLAELVREWDDDTKELATGLFCTLDRYYVNKLIRVLRHARGQAFGKDE
jgi:hypothetical protein